MKSTFDEFKKIIKGKKVAVVGVGISNRPLIKWLFDLEADITAFDALPENDPSIMSAVKELSDQGVRINWSLGKNYLDRLTDKAFDYIFKTPKMRFEIPQLVTARQKGAVLTTEMELFIALCPCKIFAVTGSDGKTTTTTLISEMLKRGGYKVWLGGNIGTPLLNQVGNMSENDMVVLELSSFQLMYLSNSVDVAVVTNVTPNHLDFHKDYEEYISSKTNIFRYQNALGRVILNAGCDITYNMGDIARGSVTLFASEYKDAVRNGEDSRNSRAYIDGTMLTYEEDGISYHVIDEKDIFIPGRHNTENFLAAMSAVWGYVSLDDIVSVGREFKGVEHRIEFIREIDGVSYYNSSIDTSPNRTINTMKALKSRNMRGVLIAGGADKKCDYKGLGDAILDVCNRIIIYGSNAPFVKDILAKEADGRDYELIEIESQGDEVYEFENTRQIVVDNFSKALMYARSMAKPGEIVILSSIGTSYDHFRHFEHRGDMFKELVNQM